MPPFSKSEIDKLGERLRSDSWSEDDLRMLDAYRLSFAAVCNQVVTILREDLGLTPTARPSKSTTSIVDKLKRESIRLSQVQDIAGCRVVVDGVLEQEAVLRQLEKVLPDLSLVDRRRQPSH